MDLIERVEYVGSVDGTILNENLEFLMISYVYS